MEGINEHKDYVYVYGVGEFHIQVLQYNPLTGSSYSPLSEFIKNTKSIVNIKNNDNLCFLWCCIASRHLPERDAERVKQYEQYLKEFKYDASDMPMKVNKILKFEKANNVKINVYMVENEKNKTKIPIYMSKQDHDEVINLFFHDNHYSLIKTYSRFCGGRHDYNCPNCMKSYANTDCYKRHLAMCKDLNQNGSNVIMPKENTVTQFNDYAKQKRLPVVIYADFESSLMKHEDEKKKYITTKHTANSYRIRIVSDVDLGIDLNYEYVGNDTDIHFVKKITELDRTITYRLRALSEKNIKPKLTKAEQLSFSLATKCSLCGTKFSDNETDFKLQKVRDHCHFTGKYCGSAHSKCNIKATQLVKEVVCL
jgi:hypothetical protein